MTEKEKKGKKEKKEMGRRQTKCSIPVADRISDGERKERKEGKEE
jgi:hypothetical protein